MFRTNGNVNLLNCNNYHVSELESGEHWYAQCGTRSLYAYSKISDKSFRAICEELLAFGQCELYRTDNDTKIVLTSI